MIENVSTQLTVFHCSCPLPASRKGLRLPLRSALFGEGGSDWRPCYRQQRGDINIKEQYEYVIFFEDQVYDWGRFKKNCAAYPYQNYLQVTPPPPPPSTKYINHWLISATRPFRLSRGLERNHLPARTRKKASHKLLHNSSLRDVFFRVRAGR